MTFPEKEKNQADSIFEKIKENIETSFTFHSETLNEYK